MDTGWPCSQYHRKTFETVIQRSCSPFSRWTFSPFLGGTNANAAPAYIWAPSTPPLKSYANGIVHLALFALARLVILFDILQLILRVWNTLFTVVTHRCMFHDQKATSDDFPITTSYQPIVFHQDNCYDFTPEIFCLLIPMPLYVYFLRHFTFLEDYQYI